MSETSPITEQANPETELARDRCSPEDLPHDALQTIPRTEPVVQVSEQINAKLENLSVGAGRTQVEEEEEDVVNDSGILVQPDAGGSSSGGLKRIPSMTRGFPFLVSSLKPVGQAFEDNRNAIWSWLMNDEISTIGICGMGGIGKTTILQHIHNELLQRPDISRHVYWVTVSSDFSIYKLQNLIAKHLDLDLSSEYDILPRAAKLSEELRKKQEWILILDDLWESFELSAVGIPVPLKGCKVVLTTRSEAVCRQMNSRNNVRVNPLSRKEAWTLFMEKLGHGVALSPEVERIAVDIARECAGLPLGIITLAGSLRGVDDQDEWRNTLEKLKELKSGDMEDEVFRMLRFSYDRLDDKLQQCLLYCTLFPEDYNIKREELIFYLIDEGIIQKMWSREATFDKGHTMLDRLENAGLLQRIDGGRAVKMHDLVRDMAIYRCRENPSVMEQRRKGIEMAGSNIDRLWNHVEQMNDGGNSTHKTMGQRRKRIEMAPLKSGWTLLLTSLILEIASAVFDQLGNALVGMVLAFVALLLSTADLIRMARKGRMSILTSFHRTSTATFVPGKPAGTIVEYFGLVGAVWQCFYSTVGYAYARQKKDNPIKMCLLPFFFLSCVAISKLIKTEFIGNSTHKTMVQRRKRIEMAPLKSGWTGAVSASAREQNNVDMAQQREPLLTGECERANDLTEAGIELPPDTPDDQDELKKLKGSKSRDMVDDFESGWTGAVSASAREQNNVDKAQQREPLFKGEFERANDLTGAGIDLPPDTPDDQEPLFLALDSVHHVDRIVPPMIDENYNRREATERLVQPDVCASAFVFYENHNAILTGQQENVAGDEEISRWLMSSDDGDEELLKTTWVSSLVGNEIEFMPDQLCEMHDAIETIPRPEQVKKLKRGSSLPSTNQADEPLGASSPPKNLLCPGIESYYGQLCSPSVKHDVTMDDIKSVVKVKTEHGVIMDDVQSVVKEKTEPIASMLEQSNAILDKLAGAEEESICLHPEAESGMENTCAEYIQHVDINDSLEQTRLLESTSGRLVQPGTSASSTKLVGRAYVKNAIWSCLMDDKVSIIGIYGMGGNGKTTMLRNICTDLLERQDISHSIYWVNVPQDFRIDKSQDLIAKRLDLNLSSKDDDQCRVVELAKELMMKQKWILILNDLWNSFDPQELGIPIPLNGSKFIMTTRSKIVCQQMNCQNSIRVDPLSDEEAWTLFMEKLGHDRQLSQEEQQIAKDAVRECVGLPLGIVTLAESLKGVHELYKWKITLRRLKESNFWEMEDQIFQILRLSYDCLDDSTKECFVYCALIDESQKIERRELIESFIEEGIIKEFDKGHSILDSLENVCLLERIDDGKAVKMHDLLRDMAIQILDDEYSLDMKK